MRRLLAVIAVVGLAITAGCLGPGAVEEAALKEPASYDWNTSHEATITIDNGSYQAVLSLQNQRNVSLFGPGGFGGEAALPVSAVQYRYPNGTVLNASSLTVKEQDERTVIEAPTDEGQIAYTGAIRSSTLFLSVAVNGTHAVRLPAGTDVRAPIVGQANPRNYDVASDSDRLTLVWENPDTEVISVDYYSERNLYIFAGLLAIGAAIAGGGVLYFRRQLTELATKRGEMDPEDGLE